MRQNGIVVCRCSANGTQRDMQPKIRAMFIDASGNDGDVGPLTMLHQVQAPSDGTRVLAMEVHDARRADDQSRGSRGVVHLSRSR